MNIRYPIYEGVYRILTVIIETEKTVIKVEKKKETKEKRGEKPKEKAARRNQTADNTVLALKNNFILLQQGVFYVPFCVMEIPKQVSELANSSVSIR